MIEPMDIKASLIEPVTRFELEERTYAAYEYITLAAVHCDAPQHCDLSMSHETRPDVWPVATISTCTQKACLALTSSLRLKFRLVVVCMGQIATHTYNRMKAIILQIWSIDYRTSHFIFVINVSHKQKILNKNNT